MTSLPTQSYLPPSLLPYPSLPSLQSHFVGKSLSELRTPAVIIDRAQVKKNCDEMGGRCQRGGVGLRCHLKTHKTPQGTRYMLQSPSLKTDRVVVSTLAEAWGLVKDGLGKKGEGVVRDILYGLPVPVDKLVELDSLRQEFDVVRLLIDNPVHLSIINAYELSKPASDRKPWSAFIKIDVGNERAGLPPGSDALKNLLGTLVEEQKHEAKGGEKKGWVDPFGFYTHASLSYSSTSTTQASKFLEGEIAATNDACNLALSLGLSPRPTFSSSSASKEVAKKNGGRFVLSVGATPTAHVVARNEELEEWRRMLKEDVKGDVEVHAGNYPILDLQQVATSLVSPVANTPNSSPLTPAITVLTRIVSIYPHRSPHQLLTDAGAIAYSKDTGPKPGFGVVVPVPGQGEFRGKGWYLARMSQEHGIITPLPSNLSQGDMVGIDSFKLGQELGVMPQHACLTAAAYPWYYIVDSEDKGQEGKVVDVWVPWKNW